MGTEVAGVKLSEVGPLVVLAEHLEGTRPILIYRVGNLREAVRRLEEHGWKRDVMLEIPHGPCCTFTAEGGQRLAIYELTGLKPIANSWAASTPTLASHHRHHRRHREHDGGRR